jgi:hypothetical protein
MANLPSYIKSRDPNTQTLAQRGLANVGSGSGPYISIEGNHFTLVDAAGGKMPVQTLHLDVCIIDINDHMSKEYRPPEDKYDPNNPLPPMCWSDNGVAPSSSVAAHNAQSVTCAACPHQVWGSKISQKGNEVQACRDIQKIAVIVPGMPNNIFRLTIPPNSFKLGWRPYLAKFNIVNFDIWDVVTRLTFKQGEMGTLEFNPAPSPWLDDATVQCRDKALAAKASDVIVGRLDRPRQQDHSSASPQGGTTQEEVKRHLADAPAEPAKRRRRTNAEIAADNVAKGGQGAAAMAPFRPEAQAQPQPQPNGPAFGVGQGVAPNQELAASIKDIFG